MKINVMAKVVSPLFAELRNKLGDVEFRVRRNRIIELAKKRIPSNPRTDAQMAIRQKYGQLVEQWRSLSEAEKQQYEQEAKRYAISGWNYFVMVKMPVTALVFDNDGGGVWNRYINIPITSAPSEYAQYRILINGDSIEVYSADGTLKTSGTGMTDFWNNVKSDGSDIRAFDNNQNQLYFFVENFDYAGQTATIWVRVEANITELNIAYGNSLATKSTYEDGNQVFEYFDDFEGTDISADWVASAGVTYSVSNSVLTVSEPGTAWENVRNTNPFTYPSIFRIKAKVSSDAAGAAGNTYVIAVEDRAMTGSYIGAGFDRAGIGADRAGVNSYQTWREGTGTDLSKTANYESWQVLRIEWQSTSVKFATEGVEEVTSTTNIPLDNMSFIFWVYGRTAYIDFVQVLKFADPASFGTPTIVTL